MSANTDNRQCFRSNIMKIFGIGLSKTGTKSLNMALEILGFKSWHDPRLLLKLDDNELYLSTNITHDALTDSAVARMYKELDIRFPKSKFILTTREMNKWLASCEKFFWAGRWPEDKITAKLHLDLYGGTKFNLLTFKNKYNEHQKNVLFYFKDRREDLLVLDICGGEGWEKLCPFLGLPVLKQPFPHKTTYV